LGRPFSRFFCLTGKTRQVHLRSSVGGTHATAAQAAL